MTSPTADTARPSPSEERFDPNFMTGRLIEAEHLARYTWAAQFAGGKRILDAACGTAYGTAMLAEAGAAEVIGVDLDPGVIAKADEQARPGTGFRIGDLCDLPFGDREFDLVVCFEAIEHVPEPERALDELSRVLSEDGVLLVSTPNRNVYPPGNPFHLRELTPNELEAELGSRFRSVSLRRQHTWIASALLDDKAFESGDNAAVEGLQVHKAVAGKPATETYTIGIASNADLPTGSGLVDLTADIDIRDWSARLEAADLALAAPLISDASTSDAKLELLRGELIELRRQLVKGESEMARFADLEARLAATRGAFDEHEALKEQFDRVRDDYDDLQSVHQEIVHSSSWRLTAPLRRLSTFLNSRS